jgi:hypothetical protein
MEIDPGLLFERTEEARCGVAALGRAKDGFTVIHARETIYPERVGVFSCVFLRCAFSMFFSFSSIT